MRDGIRHYFLPLVGRALLLALAIAGRAEASQINTARYRSRCWWLWLWPAEQRRASCSKASLNS
jgi:hypothetical protein